MDRQSEAYRKMTDSDRVTDDELFEFAEAGYPADHPGHGPEWYEQGEGWDTGRETPKTREEATEALNRRIADDAAPDDETHRGAYDEDD